MYDGNPQVVPAIDFGARYYSPSLGRFMTPDWSATPEPIPYADLANPQSLNLYSYVLNNPVTSTDPDGHCCDPISTAIDIAIWAGLHPAGAARAVEGAKGAGMIAGGVTEIVGGAGLGTVAAPESGGISMAGAAFAASTGAGNVAAGAMKLMAAVTGNNDPNLGKAQTLVQTVANPAGLVTTVGALAMGKSPDAAIGAGANVAAVTGAVITAGDVANFSNLNTIGKAATATGVLDTVDNAKKAACNQQTPCGAPSSAGGGSAKPPGGGN